MLSLSQLQLQTLSILRYRSAVGNRNFADCYIFEREVQSGVLHMDKGSDLSMSDIAFACSDPFANTPILQTVQSSTSYMLATFNAGKRLISRTERIL